MRSGVARGVRGRPPADLKAVVLAAMGLAALAEDLSDLVAEIDVNPLIALPDRAVVVDALIVPRTRPGTRSTADAPRLQKKHTGVGRSESPFWDDLTTIGPKTHISRSGDGEWGDDKIHRWQVALAMRGRSYFLYESRSSALRSGPLNPRLLKLASDGNFSRGGKP